MRLHQRANPADQKTITRVNRYVCHDLSVCNMRLKSHLLSINAEPSREYSTQQIKATLLE